MTKARNRIIISFLVITFVLLSVMATIMLVFAMQQQNISTSLNISYTAVDIDGSVSGTYKVGGVTKDLQPNADADHIGGTNNNSLLFFADDTDNAGTLEFPTDDTQINFTSQNSSMVMQYTFTNNGDVHYIASMSFDAELTYENMKVEYSINGKDYSEQRYAVVVPANSEGKSYWIRISIDKLTKNASFSGDFDWLLYSCDEQSEEYLSYEAIQMQGSNGSYSVSYKNPGRPFEALTIPNNINGDPVTKIVANTSATAEEKAILKSVHVPASVTEIGANAFQNYTSLETVTFEQNETRVSTLNSSGLVSIGWYAFQGCKKLKIFNFPVSLKNISSRAFANCSSLTSVVLPNSLTYIGDVAFGFCTGIKNIIIPDNVTTINHGLFIQCFGLQKVVLGKGVKSVASQAFEHCAVLSEVWIPKSVTYIEAKAFYMPAGTTIKKLIIEEINSFVSINFVAATSNPLERGAKLYLSSDTETPLTDITIDRATKISNYAFYNYRSLNSIKIGESVTSIGANTFQYCIGLTNVEIGSGVKSIGKNAFVNCTNLANVTFENTENWYVADSATATSGTDILSTDLAIPTTAATYLTSSDYYVGKYWICSTEN